MRCLNLFCVILMVSALSLSLNAAANENAKRDETKEQALFKAIQANDLKAIEELIKAGADINKVSERKETALFHAQSSEVVQSLLAGGMKVNAKDCDGNTALFNANAPDVIQALIVAGANANTKNKYGYTALMSAAQSSNLKK